MAVVREQWSRELDYVLACIGNAIGLGNLWRFPYLCYASGGGAFLIPYLIMLLFTGVPLLYLEVCIGQYTRLGPVGAIKMLCPFFQGAGMGTVVLSFLFTTYYNAILAWAIYYMIVSCFNPLPWSTCDNSWNTNSCWDPVTANMTLPKPNNSQAPTEEYYKYQVLKQSSGIEDQGGMVWPLVLLLLVSWILVYFSLFKGVKWTGKVVYFTATFPYVVLIALLIRALSLPGSMIGIDFYIKPRWELLLDPKVWVNAAAQNFNSIGIAFGSMIAFASYCKPESRIFRNSMIICAVNSATSILAGFAVFSILGYVAFLQETDVSSVVSEGPGLVFIVYPAAFSSLQYPGAQIFAFLFFFMLICLAVDSQLASVECVITTFEDHFGQSLYKILKRKEVIVLMFCLLTYLCGLPNVTEAGIYYFKLIDSYSSALSLMLIAFFEVIAVSWFYGAKQLAKNTYIMTGRSVSLYWIICWYAISPLLILAILVFNYIEWTPIKYDDYEYPSWGHGIGWFLASLSLVCIPLGAIKGVLQTPGRTFLQKFINSFKPLDNNHRREDMRTDLTPKTAYTLEPVSGTTTYHLCNRRASDIGILDPQLTYSSWNKNKSTQF